MVSSEITTRLTAARILAGYKYQKDAAVALGLHKYCVSRWERGTAEPRPEQYRACARVYNRSVDWLMGLEESV